MGGGGCESRSSNRWLEREERGWMGGDGMRRERSGVKDVGGGIGFVGGGGRQKKK